MIEKVNYSSFPSDEFYTFANGTLNIVNAKKETLVFLVPFAGKLSKNLSRYQDALMRDAKNPFTKPVAASDQTLDSSFKAFRTYTVAAGYRKTEGWAMAANKLKAVIRNYGWRASAFGYKAQIAAMSNMVKEIKDKYMNEVTLLNALDWFNDWDTDLTSFIDLFNESMAQAPSDEPTLKETRPALSKSLRNMFSMVNLTMEDDDSAELAALAASINELIVKSLATVKAAGTREENTKTDEEDLPQGE